jgi:drug/metabolite transporter (DMT)-like permease
VIDMGLSSQQKGRLIMLAGIIGVSPDSFCVKFLHRSGVTPWCILVWKMLGTMVLCSTFVTAKHWGKLKPMVANLYVVRYNLVLSVLLQAAIDILFTVCIAYTSAANTLLFLSLNPIWAALLGYFILKERIARETIVALVFAFGSILLIFVPTISGEHDDGHSDTSTLGDLLALLAGLGLAMYLTSLRRAAIKCPEGDFTITTALAAAVVTTVSAAVTGTGAWPRTNGFDPARPLWQFFAVVFFNSVNIASLLAALAVAPTMISGPEVGLIMLLEVILGPLWVFVAYGDIPGDWTLIGGALLLLSLALHELYPLFICGRKSEPKSGDSEGKIDDSAPGTENLEDTETFSL